MSKFSNILVCGDSFSSPDYKVLKYDVISKIDKEKADFNKLLAYTCWPELLASHYKANLKNLSNSGRGTDYIVNNITNELSENQNYDLVIAALPPWHRFEYLHKNEVSLKNYYSLKDIKFLINENLLKLFYLICVCKEFKVPLVSFQMLSPYEFKFFEGSDYDIKNNFTKCFLQNNLIYEIPTKNIIGWPFFHNLGGFTFDGKFLSNIIDNPLADRLGYIWKFKKHKLNLVRDYHPNQTGHKNIFNVLKEYLDTHDI